MGLKKLIDLDLLDRFLNKVKELIPTTYAGSSSAGGPATVTNGIHYAQVGSASTATAFVATIPNITEYYDGLTILLKNGVITSASGFTININNLGGKPVYSNMAAATRETTIFNANYTLLLIYDSTRVAGGCWINYRGYYSDSNSVGYQLRTNSTVLKTADASRYYRLFFTSADGTHWVPANTAKDNSKTSTKTVNQRPIDPFGRIIYYSTTTNFSAESDVSASYCWDQYAFALGYSFNKTGAELTLTTKTPVYIKAAPQTDGSAIIDSTTPYVQTLPSTEDGKIYIYLGVAYSATNVELCVKHPVYYYANGAIRPWVNQNGSAVTAMTDQEIENAFNAGWPDLFELDGGMYVETNNIISVTLDGTYGQSAGIATLASEGDTVTVQIAGPNWVPDFYRKDNNARLALTNVATNVYSFTMPESDVMLVMIFDD